MTRYVVADLHIGHKSISNFRKGFGDISSEEHWNLALEGLRGVRKRDTIFFLGDIAFYPEWLEEIKGIQCNNKILLCGNHDTHGKITMKHLVDVYDKVYSLYSYKNSWLTHCPIHPQEMRDKVRVVHGHLHDKLVVDGGGLSDKRFINCSTEYTGYTPQTWEYIISAEYQQECEKKWIELYGRRV